MAVAEIFPARDSTEFGRAFAWDDPIGEDDAALPRAQPTLTLDDVPRGISLPAEFNTLESVESKFGRLKKQWLRETALSSRLRDIFMANPYQQIIGMGSPAVPLLITELRHRPLLGRRPRMVASRSAKGRNGGLPAANLRAFWLRRVRV